MKRTALIALLLATGALGWGAEQAQIRQSAEKSVALLQRVGAEWKTPCNSCHHQVLPMLALESARKHGIAVDEGLARATAEKAFRHLNDIDAAARIENLIDPALSTGSDLLAAAAAGVPANLSTSLYARFVARTQQANGNWAAFDNRPPQSSGEFTATAVAARAIQLYLPESQRAEKERGLLRARKWLLAARPESTEEHTQKLLGLHWTGADTSEIRRAGQALAALQRADGGWGQWTSVPESDAYSTSEALVALRKSGVWKAEQEEFERGIAWLLKTQSADGSWQVKSRLSTPAPVSPPYFETGFPGGRNQWISAAATSWAVMALAEALPLSQAAKAPLPLRGVAPSAEGWMEKAAFGTVEEVRQVDPKLSTPGGTTVLMLAADRADKVQALLAKGADVRAQSKAGYDALMMASLFRGNRESLAALIQAGASAKVRAKVRFDAAPLNLAIFTGDAEMVKLLLANGAETEHIFKLLGQFPMRALMTVANMDDAELVRVLVKGGAKIDAADPDGMTELSWAALGHRHRAIRALLELGAKRDAKDRFGLTPLEHTKGMGIMNGEAARLLRSPL